jgi:hypothetical protein
MYAGTWVGAIPPSNAGSSPAEWTWPPTGSRASASIIAIDADGSTGEGIIVGVAAVGVALVGDTAVVVMVI